MAATGPPFPSLTKTWHTTPYAAIDPLSPYLSAAGKTVLVTGGGSGIGAATVLAFAQAGAPRIAIIGRTLSSLERTKANINKSNPETKVLTVTGDISSKKSIDHAFTTVFDAFGKIDIFVASSGYLSSPAPVAELDTTDWFKAFEINALGMLYSLQAFKKIANNNAYLVNISTAIAHFPGIPGFSGYATSKLAGTKLVDYFAKENPEIHVVHLQPGVITTDVNIKSGMPGLDAVELPGQFIVWLTSPQAIFLKNKFTYANWDVEELMAMRGWIEESSEKLTLGLYGLPEADLSGFAP